MGAGHLTTSRSLGAGFEGKSIYVGNFTRQSVKDRITDSDSNAKFYSLDEFLRGIATGHFTSQTTRHRSQRSHLLQWNRDISGYAAKLSGSGCDRDPVESARVSVVTSHDYASTIRFGGEQNRFVQFSLGTNSTAKLVVAENTILNGDITVGSGGLWFESRASVPSGTIRSVAGQDLKLTMLADFTQLPGDATFAAGADLIVTTNGNSLRLLNRANVFENLWVATDGGSFQIASSRDLFFGALSTSGGSVQLDTPGSIKALTISAGSVSFRAGGSVVLAGTFAAARGSGSSVWLNSSAATAVLSGICSDGAVTVTGSGSTLLAGDIIGHSAVLLGTTVVVARDSSVVSSGGLVAFARSVVSLFPAVRVPGLRLDAGSAGLIVLGGSLGRPTLTLGWLELNGLVSNPSSFSAYYPGGSGLPPVGTAIGEMECKLFKSIVSASQTSTP